MSEEKVVALKAPKRKQIHQVEEHAEEGEGNWIISYADMMTLLCVFFVLMYSMADPNPKKIEQMKKETTAAFGGEYKAPYQGMVDKFKKVIEEQGLEKSVQVESDEAGVNVTFRGTVFFESGKSELMVDGSNVMAKLADVIKKEANGYKIVVEGHTDDSPIVSAVYPSNWELSGARASTVVRLFEKQGFDRKLLMAIGYADTHPIRPNRDDQGAAIVVNQGQNRRVVLRVLKDGLK